MSAERRVSAAQDAVLKVLTNGFAGWFETSAKENKNIDEASKALVSAVLQHQDIFERKGDPRRGDVIRPSHHENTSNANSSWCCSSF
ncbi:hypothetical protein ATCC90586_008350 [Pythium insidiosum]|nr:hypothetical protein ATCC90586_008350 [Pythium insidiosum]